MDERIGNRKSVVEDSPIKRYFKKTSEILRKK